MYVRRDLFNLLSSSPLRRFQQGCSPAASGTHNNQLGLVLSELKVTNNTLCRCCPDESCRVKNHTMSSLPPNPKKQRRQIYNKLKLFDLLNISGDEALDEDGIISEAKHNPGPFSSRYRFNHGSDKSPNMYPLLRVIELGASASLIEVVYDIFPQVLEMDPENLHNCLIRSISVRIENDALLFIFSKLQNPHLIPAEKNTTLSILHQYVGRREPEFDEAVVRKMIDLWPKLSEVVNLVGLTPLHVAVGRNTSCYQAVHCLLDINPKMVRVIDSFGRTALHNALRRGNIPHEVVALLLEKWPKALRMKDRDALTPAERYEETRTEENRRVNQIISKLLVTVERMYNEKWNDDEVREMIDYFLDIGWKNGVCLYMSTCKELPKEATTLPLAIFPHLIESLSEFGSIKAVWRVVNNKLDLFES